MVNSKTFLDESGSLITLFIALLGLRNSLCGKGGITCGNDSTSGIALIIRIGG